MKSIHLPPLPSSCLTPIRRESCYRPLIAGRAPAGFPSPAADHYDKRLDLNEHLVLHPEATFFLRVKGDSMIGAGIDDGDIMVIDRSLEPANNKIAVCFIDGEFTVKRIRKEKNAVYLMPENPVYPPIKITEENELIIWGIVTYVIKCLG